VADIQRARTALHEMRVEHAEMVAEDGSGQDPESRFLAALVRLLELAVDDAAAVEGMNEHTRQRAERVGGDGHTWVMHRPEWSVALDAITAWEEAHADDKADR
jgi:hypothetical protein